MILPSKCLAPGERGQHQEVLRPEVWVPGAQRRKSHLSGPGWWEWGQGSVSRGPRPRPGVTGKSPVEKAMGGWGGGGAAGGGGGGEKAATGNTWICILDNKEVLKDLNQR